MYSIFLYAKIFFIVLCLIQSGSYLLLCRFKGTYGVDGTSVKDHLVMKKPNTSGSILGQTATTTVSLGLRGMEVSTTNWLTCPKGIHQFRYFLYANSIVCSCMYCSQNASYIICMSSQK